MLTTRGALPEFCFAVLRSTGEVVAIKRDEAGYHATTYGKDATIADTMNDRLGVTPAQREAMIAGSMFGWNIPAADPDNYDEAGKFKKEVLGRYRNPDYDNTRG